MQAADTALETDTNIGLGSHFLSLYEIVTENIRKLIHSTK